MNKYMYDCYDKDEKPLGIFFENGTKELLKHHPDVKYVKGIDAVTRLPVWHKVKENGLFPCIPKKKIIIMSKIGLIIILFEKVKKVLTTCK